MGQDYNPHIKPDPNYWASCSCGEYKVVGPDNKTVIDLITEHFIENRDTHTIGSGSGSYILHIPEKPKWYRKIFGVHKGSDN